MKLLQVAKLIIEFLSELLFTCLRDNESIIAGHVRQMLLRTTCYIGSAVVITNKQNFVCGPNCALYHGTYILNNAGKIVLGNNTHLGALCYVNVYYGNLTIGNDVAIGPHTSIIVYSNHYRHGKKVTDERIVKDICIGNNVFIGANCTILPGTVIADNVVIGAGAVIRGTLESNSVYGGVPCRKIQDIT